MKNLENLIANNRAWSARIRETDPEFFERLSHQQSPEYLWIGCSDSRVACTQLVGLAPGELFVHRNVANVVVHTDLNCLSVLQYAVEALKVKHVIVCGHYGCGGVQAALADSKIGLIDNWLRHVQDVIRKHEALLAEISDETQRLRRLCEIHVIEQVANVCQTTIVRQAWERGQELTVHGWIYGIEDGLLRDLNFRASSEAEFNDGYRTTVEAMTARKAAGE